VNLKKIIEKIDNRIKSEVNILIVDFMMIILVSFIRPNAYFEVQHTYLHMHFYTWKIYISSGEEQERKKTFRVLHYYLDKTS
jgi:hypothetical protein